MLRVREKGDSFYHNLSSSCTIKTVQGDHHDKSLSVEYEL